jgi:tRNA-specific 2-thiouridylase
MPRSAGKGTSALVALSGGIDSAVAAHTLLIAGRHLEAVYLSFFPEGISSPGLFCATRVAAQLGIRLHVLDEHVLFERDVVSYFSDSYRRGLTPNPCVICNARVKIARSLALADSLGIDSLATGHYARTQLADGGRTALLRATDETKDQSYFLHQVPRDALSRLAFPLGNLTKEEVRKRGEEAGLSGLFQEESQEICFLKGDYRTFLEERDTCESRPGEIVDTEGTLLGRHGGLHGYTIGQRRGLGIADATPYYVISLDTGKNRLVVGKQEDLFSRELRVDGLNWIAPSEEAARRTCTVKVRSRHNGGTARLEILEDRTVRVLFDAPQRAVTPGQFAVFYQEDFVLGGGRICG